MKILKFKNGNRYAHGKILITGALGQIGTELTNRLVEIHGAENA